jgi:hypothetical protein
MLKICKKKLKPGSTLTLVACCDRLFVPFSTWRPDYFVSARPTPKAKHKNTPKTHKKPGELNSTRPHGRLKRPVAVPMSRRLL